MAGVSTPAFRLMARRMGAGMVFTEMVSAVGLMRNMPKTLAMAQVHQAERPVGLQLFGADPVVMARAAASVSHLDIDLIDVNLGCPAKKVRRQGSGSKLLEDPARAAEVVAAVAGATHLPVTVKLRLGFRRNDLEKLVPGLVSAGARAVCLHARTTKQGFAGRADWDAIAELASWCPVPVIGNGDIKSGAQAAERLTQSGCPAVMIGRAAMGDPWIFARARARLAGEEPDPLGLEQRRAALLEHVELAKSLGGEGRAVHFLKQFMMWYTKGLPGAVSFRRQAGPVMEMDLLWSRCQDFFDQLRKVA